MAVTGMIDTGREALFVREWGRGERAVMFLHGLGGTGQQIGEIAPLIAAPGVRLVAPDLPGSGQSPPLAREDYRTERLADVVLRLLDASGLERVDVIGFSWGASAGVYLSAAHPERLRSLVLLDGGYVDWPEMPEYPGQAAWEERLSRARELESQFVFGGWAEWEASIRERYHRLPPERLESFRSQYREQDGAVAPWLRAETFAAALEGGELAPPSHVLARIQANLPVLLLSAGEPERMREVRESGRWRFARMVPHAEIRVLPDLSHDLLGEGGPEVGRIVADWLALSS